MFGFTSIGTIIDFEGVKLIMTYLIIVD